MEYYKCKNLDIQLKYSNIKIYNLNNELDQFLS